jgi:hypothetical protein
MKKFVKANNRFLALLGMTERCWKGSAVALWRDRISPALFTLSFRMKPDFSPGEMRNPILSCLTLNLSISG